MIVLGGGERAPASLGQEIKMWAACSGDTATAFMSGGRLNRLRRGAMKQEKKRQENKREMAFMSRGKRTDRYDRDGDVVITSRGMGEGRTLNVIQ